MGRTLPKETVNPRAVAGHSRSFRRSPVSLNPGTLLGALGPPTETDMDLKTRSLWSVVRVVVPVAWLLATPVLALGADAPTAKPGMIVAIVTYVFPEPVSVRDVKRAAARGAQRYLNLPGLLRKNYCLSEDGLRASGVYVWESRARAEAFYDAEWRATMTRQYGVPPEIVYLHSPVMVDNAAGRIVVDEE